MLADVIDNSEVSLAKASRPQHITGQLRPACWRLRKLGVLVSVTVLSLVVASCGSEEEAGVRSTPVEAWTYDMSFEENLRDWTTAYGAEIGVVYLKGSDQVNRIDGVDLISGESTWIRDVPSDFDLHSVSDEVVVMVSNRPVLAEGRSGQHVLFLEIESGETLYEGSLAGEMPQWHGVSPPGIFTVVGEETVRRVDSSGAVLWEHTVAHPVRHMSVQGESVILELGTGGRDEGEHVLRLDTGEIQPWFSSGDPTAEYRTAGDVVVRRNPEQGSVERLGESGEVLWTLHAGRVFLKEGQDGEVQILTTDDNSDNQTVQRLEPDSGAVMWTQQLGHSAGLGPSVGWITEDVFTTGAEVRSLADGHVLVETADRVTYSDGHILYGLDHTGALRAYGADGALWRVSSRGGQWIEHAPRLITADDTRLIGWGS